MNFTEWKNWFNQKPKLVKFFLLIMLSKPVFDLLWDVNFPGTSVSFLQIFGILIILLSLALILLVKKAAEYKIPIVFWLWAGLLIFNSLLVIANNFSVFIIGDILKYIMQLYLILAFTRIVSNEKDLDGILITFYYSFYATLGVFIISLFQGHYQITRGAERIITEYGDIASIGLNFNLAYIIILFFFTKTIFLSGKFDKRFFLKFIFILISGILILIKIHHATSFVIFGASSLIFFSVLLKKKTFSFIILLIALLIPSFFLFESDIATSVPGLFETDIGVLEGTNDTHVAFHGRAGRWEKHLEIYNSQSTIEKFFGFIGIEHPSLMGHGTHNDYLRIMYSSGYIGLACYVMYLIIILIRGIKHPRGIKLITISVIALVMLMSVTLTPSTYHSINFIFLPIVVFLSIRHKKVNEKNPLLRKTPPALHRPGFGYGNNPKFKARKRI